MLIHDIDEQRADALEAELTDVRDLEGFFRLEEWQPGRYHIVQATGAEQGFRAVTGLGAEFGRITVLRSPERCVVMVGATAKPFV